MRAHPPAHRGVGRCVMMNIQRSKDSVQKLALSMWLLRTKLRKPGFAEAPFLAKPPHWVQGARLKMNTGFLLQLE